MKCDYDEMTSYCTSTTSLMHMKVQMAGKNQHKIFSIYSAVYWKPLQKRVLNTPDIFGLIVGILTCLGSVITTFTRFIHGLFIGIFMLYFVTFIYLDLYPMLPAIKFYKIPYFLTKLLFFKPSPVLHTSRSYGICRIQLALCWNFSNLM